MCVRPESTVGGRASGKSLNAGRTKEMFEIHFPTEKLATGGEISERVTHRTYCVTAGFLFRFTLLISARTLRETRAQKFGGKPALPKNSSRRMGH